MTQTQPVIPIQKGQDFYVPAFKILLGNKPASRQIIRDILRVSYKDSLTEIDSFEITINNWNEQTFTFRYSDGNDFIPGQRLELYMGYFGDQNMRKMLTGEITALRPSFPAGGQQTLVVSGLNLLHRLRKKQETHAYENLSDNQIAKKIAQRLGITIDADPNGAGANNADQNKYIIQYHMMDILFLLQRARAIGYDLFVNEEAPGQSGGPGGAAQSGGPTKLKYGPSQNVKAVTYKIEYGKTLIEFSPTLTTVNQVGSVTVNGWDAVKKQPISVTVNRKQAQVKGVGSKGGQEQIEQAFNDREEIIVNHPVRSKQEAETLARQTLEDIAKEMVKGSGTVVGLPSLRAGSVIQLEGLGNRFSGRYFVTSTTHTIEDSGYLTHFDCRREEL